MRRLEAINKNLDLIASRIQPFRLRIEGTGVFPSSRKPRILWLGIVDRKKKLAGVADTIIDEMAKLGFAPEKRGFKAHLTIARIKEPQSAGHLAERHLQIRYEPVEFEVEIFVIEKANSIRPVRVFKTPSFSGCRRASKRNNKFHAGSYFSARYFSIAAVTSRLSGVSFDENRATTLPLRSTRNLLKFHDMSPAN